MTIIIDTKLELFYTQAVEIIKKSLRGEKNKIKITKEDFNLLIEMADDAIIDENRELDTFYDDLRINFSSETAQDSLIIFFKKIINIISDFDIIQKKLTILVDQIMDSHELSPDFLNPKQMNEEHASSISEKIDPNMGKNVEKEFLIENCFKDIVSEKYQEAQDKIISYTTEFYKKNDQTDIIPELNDILLKLIDEIDVVSLDTYESFLALIKTVINMGADISVLCGINYEGWFIEQYKKFKNDSFRKEIFHKIFSLTKEKYNRIEALPQDAVNLIIEKIPPYDAINLQLNTVGVSSKLANGLRYFDYESREKIKIKDLIEESINLFSEKKMFPYELRNKLFELVKYNFINLIEFFLQTFFSYEITTQHLPRYHNNYICFPGIFHEANDNQKIIELLLSYHDEKSLFILDWPPNLYEFLMKMLQNPDKNAISKIILNNSNKISSINPPTTSIWEIIIDHKDEEIIRILIDKLLSYPIGLYKAIDFLKISAYAVNKWPLIFDELFEHTVFFLDKFICVDNRDDISFYKINNPFIGINLFKIIQYSKNALDTLLKKLDPLFFQYWCYVALTVKDLQTCLRYQAPNDSPEHLTLFIEAVKKTSNLRYLRTSEMPNDRIKKFQHFQCELDKSLFEFIKVLDTEINPIFSKKSDVMQKWMILVILLKLDQSLQTFMFHVKKHSLDNEFKKIKQINRNLFKGCKKIQQDGFENSMQVCDDLISELRPLAETQQKKNLNTPLISYAFFATSSRSFCFGHLFNILVIIKGLIKSNLVNQMQENTSSRFLTDTNIDSLPHESAQRYC